MTFPRRTPTRKDDIDYLRSLVRMDIRRKQKSIDKFAPREWQTEQDAAIALQKITDSLEYRRGVLARLEGRTD